MDCKEIQRGLVHWDRINLVEGTDDGIVADAETSFGMSASQMTGRGKKNGKWKYGI